MSKPSAKRQVVGVSSTSPSPSHAFSQQESCALSGHSHSASFGSRIKSTLRRVGTVSSSSSPSPRISSRNNISSSRSSTDNSSGGQAVSPSSPRSTSRHRHLPFSLSRFPRSSSSFASLLSLHNSANTSISNSTDSTSARIVPDDEFTHQIPKTNPDYLSFPQTQRHDFYLPSGEPSTTKPPLTVNTNSLSTTTAASSSYPEMPTSPPRSPTESVDFVKKHSHHNSLSSRLQSAFHSRSSSIESTKKLSAATNNKRKSVPIPAKSRSSSIASLSSSCSSFSVSTTPKHTTTQVTTPCPSSPRISVKETNHINFSTHPVTGRDHLNTYEIIKEIGRGNHGIVNLGRNLETEELVAIKTVDKAGRPKLGRQPSTSHEEKVRREIAIMKKCCHPNIVQLKEVLDDTHSREIFLVLEYLEGGEVKWQQAGGSIMSQDDARKICRDVISGLEYLHFQGIIHRDIKPANLLKDKNGTVKISDFGVSYASSVSYPKDEIELAKTAGTPAFFAPELCVASCTDDDQGSSKPPQTVTSKIDIWAFGVTLYCLLFGKVPFIAVSEFDLFNVIVNEPLVFPDEVENVEVAEKTIDQQPLSSMFYNRQVPPTIPATKIPAKPCKQLTPGDPALENAKDLLKHVLEKDPEKRFDIIDIKHHPWMLEGLEDFKRDLFLTMTREDERIVVTSEDVDKAVLGIRGRLKKKLSRALRIAGIGRKNSTSSSTASSSVGPSRSSSIDPARRTGPPSRQNSREDYHHSLESSRHSTTVHSSGSLTSLNSSSSAKVVSLWRPIYNNSSKEKAAPPFVPYEGQERRRSSLGTNCLHLEGDEDFGASTVRQLVPRRIPASASHLDINGLLNQDPMIESPVFFNNDSSAITSTPRASNIDSNKPHARPTSNGSVLSGSSSRVGSPLRGSVLEESAIHSEPLPMEVHEKINLGVCDDHYNHYDSNKYDYSDNSNDDSCSTSSSESGEEFVLNVSRARRLSRMASESALRKDGTKPQQPLTPAITSLLANRSTTQGDNNEAGTSRRPSTAGPITDSGPSESAGSRVRSRSVAIGVIQNDRRRYNEE